MKNLTTGLFVLVTLMVTSCFEPEENEKGWTFCSCNSVHSDLKGELATETNADEREMLEMEIQIVEEECPEYLLLDNPSPEEFKEHFTKKHDCP